MTYVYRWICSLVSYMMFMTMILNLLPDKKYEKYLRWFAGMVFLLVLFAPFTNLTGLESKMAGTFERITFQTEAKLLQKEIMEADAEKMRRLTEQYRITMSEEIRLMAEDVIPERMVCSSVEVVIEEDAQTETFGALKNIQMVFRIGSDVDQEHMLEANLKLMELRTRIGKTYGMDEQDITITLKTE